MFPTLKSEFRKLLTVRSTYFITAFLVLLVSFISLFAFGYKQVSQKSNSPTFMLELFGGMMNTASTFFAIVAILLIVHEYRYNTINYTFTLARSRLKVLGSKVVVMLAYATIVTLLLLALAYVCARIGVALKGDVLVAQSIPGDLWWQLLSYAWGYTLIGIVIAILFRSIAGSIVTFFVAPIIEQLLSLLLKDNTKYLPFRALDSIPPVIAPMSQNLSHTAALGVFSLYLLAFGAIAVWLFNKRDAN